MNLTDQLMGFKKTIDEAGQESTKLIGIIEQETKQLKSKHGLASVDAANKKLTKMGAELDEMDGQLEDGLVELKGMMP